MTPKEYKIIGPDVMERSLSQGQFNAMCELFMEGVRAAENEHGARWRNFVRFNWATQGEEGSKTYWLDMESVEEGDRYSVGKAYPAY